MKNPSQRPTSELRDSVLALKPFFYRAALFSLISSLLVLAPSAYMLEVYDRVVNSRNHLTLAMLTLLVLAAYAVMEVLDWARSEVMRSAGEVFDQGLRGRVFHAVFAANLQKQPGGTHFTFHDFRSVKDFFSSPALLAVMELPVTLVLLCLIFAVSPMLGWTAVIGAIVQTAIAWLNEKNTRPPLMVANIASRNAQNYADSSLRNAQVIESMGMLPSIRQQWMQRQEHVLVLQGRASDQAGIFGASSKFWQQIIGSGLLGLSCWALLRNELNGGAAMMIVASILGGRVLAPLVQIVAQWQTVVNVRDAWQRLNDLLALIPMPTATMPLPAPSGALSVENVVAAPPGTNQPVVRGVSFQLAPGEAVAVVGPSASGKSSLARLLVGLWPTAGGKVRLDGVDIHGWNKAELGPHIGYLPQNVQLFEGTVAENIARFGALDMDKVEAAARAVGLHELILDLPDGYESAIGPEGAVLSGGQRQRVALARAIYDRPVYVVLDEPNSSLDETGDLALAQAIQTLKAQGTTFVIMTHRTSILAAVDKILVLKEGQVQSFGKRDEVLAKLGQSRLPATPAAQPKPVPVPQGL